MNKYDYVVIRLQGYTIQYGVLVCITHYSEIRSVCSTFNALEKCFKICHILGIQKPRYFFSYFFLCYFSPLMNFLVYVNIDQGIHFEVFLWSIKLSINLLFLKSVRKIFFFFWYINKHDTI